jgi:hypothetical protein
MAVDLEKLARQILARRREEGAAAPLAAALPKPQADLLVLARRILAESRQKRDDLGGPQKPKAAPSPPVGDAFPFASGLKPGQMWGFAELGWGIGFSLAERRDDVSKDMGRRAWADILTTLDAIHEHLPGGFRVLVDNGAVQEVDLATMQTQAAITDDQWQLRMGRFVELARRYGDAAWLITPDKVGDQAESIRRLERYAPRLREAAGHGAVLLLTLQPGPLDPVGLEERLRTSLRGVPDRQIVPAFPMRLVPGERRTVTPLPVLVDYVRRRRPRVVHLLGMGPKSRQLTTVLQALAAASPSTRVTLDAAVVRSVAARAWTDEKPAAEQQVRRGPKYTPQGLSDLDPTEVLFELEPEQRRRAALRAGATPACADRLARDPDAYGILAGWGDEEDPCFGVADERLLDESIFRERFVAEPKFGPASGVSERERILVRRVFGKQAGSRAEVRKGRTGPSDEQDLPWLDDFVSTAILASGLDEFRHKTVDAALRFERSVFAVCDGQTFRTTYVLAHGDAVHTSPSDPPFIVTIIGPKGHSDYREEDDGLVDTWWRATVAPHPLLDGSVKEVLVDGPTLNVRSP